MHYPPAWCSHCHTYSHSDGASKLPPAPCSCYTCLLVQVWHKAHTQCVPLWCPQTVDSSLPTGTCDDPHPLIASCLPTDPQLEPPAVRFIPTIPVAPAMRRASAQTRSSSSPGPHASALRRSAQSPGAPLGEGRRLWRHTSAQCFLRSGSRELEQSTRRRRRGAALLSRDIRPVCVWTITSLH